ncbi:MAG TPA: NAD-dependent epimerase/dehydratase family protein [Candidatus Polarisedimenticolaceae bacterium]|nr:NAD-dependent epimerase/dehydratase family protein [Candidatus Polarisedimenticolaceae bacterium]
MRTLITGASGFIGSRLAYRCVELGHVVRVLTEVRNDVERQYLGELGTAGVEAVVGSVTDFDAVRRAHDGVERVFHLAAAQHEANVPDGHFWKVNVDGTRNMLQASVESGVSRFVHGSSIGVYGWTPNQPIRDDSALDPDNIYGVTKLAGEQAVREFAERLPCVIVRISEVYGPGDRRLIKLFRGVRDGKFPIIGDGKNLHHLIYIDDLLDGLMAAAERPEAVGQTFVLAGVRPVSTIEMIEAVAAELGTKPPRLRVPLAPVMLAARLAEALLRPFGIQPPIHPRRMNFYRKSFAFGMTAAREAIGFAPKVDLRTGLAATKRWYVEQRIL